MESKWGSFSSWAFLQHHSKLECHCSRLLPFKYWCTPLPHPCIHRCSWHGELLSSWGEEGDQERRDPKLPNTSDGSTGAGWIRSRCRSEGHQDQAGGDETGAEGDAETGRGVPWCHGFSHPKRREQKWCRRQGEVHGVEAYSRKHTRMDRVISARNWALETLYIWIDGWIDR